jgi:hypothetical protein
MCDPHESWTWDKNQSTTHGFSTGQSSTYSTSWCDSGTPDDRSNTQMGVKPGYKTDPLEMELLRLKELLRVAVQDMPVARFAELRRQFENIWLEVLEEL